MDVAHRSVVPAFQADHWCAVRVHTRQAEGLKQRRLGQRPNGMYDTTQ